MDDRTFALLKRRLATLLDLDLEAYKVAQMRRRLDHYVEMQAGGDPRAFVERLGKDAGALQALRDMLTINVTEFFRDASQWQRLERELLPELISTHGRLRVWSAGCSLGHEPYSLAMLLHEQGALESARIVATDFDRGALARARAGGPFGESEVQPLGARRWRYLEERDDGWYVTPRLRRAVRFAELNLLRDVYERQCHLIACRNVLIYFTPEVKRRVVRMFLDALAPGGMLFIGGTESLLSAESEGFERAGGNFYRRARPALGMTA